VGGSYYFHYNPGQQIFIKNFWMFFKEMILILPVMLLLIGLFDVWIPREKVQQHIGEASGIKGMLLVMLLAFIQAGPLYAAFPVAYLLWKKGCSPSNVFIYLSAFTTAKIPMLTFEIGFLGLKFSLLRILITIPVFVLIGIIMGRYFKRNGGRINEV
jgi:uncharacterized membrane protein YraQ (UPF0718 family)